MIGIALVLAIAGLLLFTAVPSRLFDASAQVDTRAELELRRALAELREAIGAYRADHGTWPSYAAETEGARVAAQDRWFAHQLEQLPRIQDQATSSSPRTLRSSRPYLTHGVPVNPFNGSARVRVLEPAEAFPEGPRGHWGWVYSPTTGEVRANASGFLVGSGVRIFEL